MGYRRRREPKLDKVMGPNYTSFVVHVKKLGEYAKASRWTLNRGLM